MDGLWIGRSFIVKVQKNFWNPMQKTRYENLFPLPRNRKGENILLSFDVNDHVYSKSKSF